MHYFAVAYILMVLALSLGWVMNLATLITAVLADAPVNLMVIARFVGVFALPLGGVLGYL